MEVEIIIISDSDDEEVRAKRAREAERYDRRRARARKAAAKLSLRLMPYNSPHRGPKPDDCAPLASAPMSSTPAPVASAPVPATATPAPAAPPLAPSSTTSKGERSSHGEDDLQTLLDALDEVPDRSVRGGKSTRDSTSSRSLASSVSTPPGPLPSDLQRLLSNSGASFTPPRAEMEVTGRIKVVPSSFAAPSPLPEFDDSQGAWPTRTMRSVEWPRNVPNLRTQFNPLGLKFEDVGHFGKCGCKKICRRHTCRNARLGLFCTEESCQYKGECWNAVAEHTSLVLVRRPGTKELGVATNAPLKNGVTLGEYIGEFVLESARAKERAKNNGYRLLMTTRALQYPGSRVCIDAKKYGGMMRFVNHSCVPNARFFEVSNGDRHTVVAATCRPVQKGEEILVDYGPDLWFLCKCDEETCRHSHLHDN